MIKSNRIQITSRALKWVFIILLILNPIVLIIGWLQFPKPLFGASPISIAIMPDVAILNPVPIGNLLLGILLSMIPMICTMLVCYFLIKLFQAYESGSFFNNNGTTCFKRVAQFLFFRELINPFYQAAISATLTWHNPPGHRIAVASIGSDNLYSILIAAIVLLISWIMAEAYSIHQEQKYTI